MWTTGSFIQLIVAESPVSGYGRAAIRECGTYMYANKNLRENQYRKQPLESGFETRMLTTLLLWTPSLKYCSKLKGEYKNLKSGSGTSVGPSLSPHILSFKKFSWHCPFKGTVSINCNIIDLLWIVQRSKQIKIIGKTAKNLFCNLGDKTENIVKYFGWWNKSLLLFFVKTYTVFIRLKNVSASF